MSLGRYLHFVDHDQFFLTIVSTEVTIKMKNFLDCNLEQKSRFEMGPPTEKFFYNSITRLHKVHWGLVNATVEVDLLFGFAEN